MNWPPLTAIDIRAKFLTPFPNYACDICLAAATRRHSRKGRLFNSEKLTHAQWRLCTTEAHMLGRYQWMVFVHASVLQ